MVNNEELSWAKRRFSLKFPGIPVGLFFNKLLPEMGIILVRKWAAFYHTPREELLKIACEEAEKNK